MIRIALAATAFLGATLALVFLLPKSGPGLPEDSAVTRTDSVFSQPSTAPAGPNLPAPTSQAARPAPCPAQQQPPLHRPSHPFC